MSGRPWVSYVTGITYYGVDWSSAQYLDEREQKRRRKAENSARMERDFGPKCSTCHQRSHDVRKCAGTAAFSCYAWVHEGCGSVHRCAVTSDVCLTCPDCVGLCSVCGKSTCNVCSSARCGVRWRRNKPQCNWSVCRECALTGAGAHFQMFSDNSLPYQTKISVCPSCAKGQSRLMARFELVARLSVQKELFFSAARLICSFLAESVLPDSETQSRGCVSNGE